MHQSLGAAPLVRGKPAEAAFREALERTPNNGRFGGEAPPADRL